MRCVNEECYRNPMDSPDKVLVNVDGDFACSKECALEYERQRDHFFSNVITSDEAMKVWLEGRRG